MIRANKANVESESSCFAEHILEREALVFLKEALGRDET